MSVNDGSGKEFTCYTGEKISEIADMLFCDAVDFAREYQRPPTITYLSRRAFNKFTMDTENVIRCLTIMKERYRSELSKLGFNTGKTA